MKPSRPLSPGCRRMHFCLWHTLGSSYRVFGRRGARASLCGSYVTKLRAFTVHVEVEGRWTHKRDSWKSSSFREGSDVQCGVRRREPENVSPHYISRRALSLGTTKLSAPTALSVDISSWASLSLCVLIWMLSGDLLDCVVACDITLVNSCTDLSHLVLPLLPLADSLLLVPVLVSDQPSTLPDHPLQLEQHARVASPSSDLSREGPFYAPSAPSDTGNYPLVSDGLPGCP